MVELPSLEASKMELDRVLDNLIQAPFLMKGWTGRSSEVTSRLGYFVKIMLFC